jgi:hypothetical protein
MIAMVSVSNFAELAGPCGQRPKAAGYPGKVGGHRISHHADRRGAGNAFIPLSERHSRPGLVGRGRETAGIVRPWLSARRSRDQWTVRRQKPAESDP